MKDDRVFVAPKTDAGLVGLSDGAKLMLLIIRATGTQGLTAEEWDNLYDDAVESAGSVGAAIEAFESGRMGLEADQ